MSSATYWSKSQARCLTPHVGDPERHAFLVGTANLRGPNEIRLLRYYEEDNELDCVAVYSHPAGEVSCLSASPYDPAVVLSVINVAGVPAASVWRMRGLPGDPEGSRFSDASATDAATPKELDRLADFPAQPSGCRLLYAQFCPASDADAAAASPPSSARILTVDDTTLRLWDLRSDGSAASVASSALAQSRAIASGDAAFIGGASWDTLHPSDVAVAVDSSVHVWDTRTGSRTRCIDRAVPAGGCVRAVSYNGNTPWHLATGGDDHKAKIWDLRRLAVPVKILDGHTHWVTCLSFNAFHDQLVLSGGADGRVNLWRASSVSSAPLLELGDDDETGVAAAGSATAQKKTEPKLAPDVAVRSHEEHEDSVYAACWSASTAWVYASLSFQGKVIVSQVPSAEKYKILL